MNRVHSPSFRPAALLSALLATCGIVPEALSSQAAQSPDPAVILRLGQSVGEVRAAGKPVTRRFEAEPGRIYLIELRQSGLDFKVKVAAPDATIQIFNSPLRRDEREFILLEPETSGDYRVTVYADEPTSAVGEYGLLLKILPAAIPSERRYIDALRLMSEGAARYDPEDRDSSLQALAAYRDAASIFRALGRKREHAQSLYSVAMLEYWAAYDWARSADVAAETAEIYAELALETLSANAKSLQAAALIEQANELDEAEAKRVFASALRLFSDAQAVHERLGNAFELAHLANNVGLTRFYMGDWPQARLAWVGATKLFNELGEWREEFNARQNQAVLDGLQGYNERAIVTLQFILDEFPDDKDPQFRLSVLDNLAENHRRFGNYEQALQTYTTARTAHRELGDSIGEAYSLVGVGNTYFSIGELDLARRYLELALPLAEAANDGRSQEAIVARLGDIEFLQADFSAAIEQHQAALNLAVSDPDHAYRQVLVARDLAALNRQEDALTLAVEAADLAERSQALATYADALVQIGRIEVDLGRPAGARSRFEHAFGIFESLGLRSGQADALNGLSATARLLGEWDDAVRYGQAAVDAVESLRERVASPELRAHYSAASQRYYESQVDLLMERSASAANDSQKYIRAALTMNESARARLTIDLLREASVNLRSHADSGVLDEESRLVEELAARAQQRDRLVGQKIIDVDTRQTMTRLDDDMTELENRLNVVRSKLRHSDPAYADISGIRTVAAEDFQRLLDDDTILLQYSLGEDHSYGWAVTRKSLVAIKLPDRASLQRSGLAVLAALNTNELQGSGRRQLDLDLIGLAAEVLFPFSDQLKGKSRLLIVPDGVLEYLPFGVFPTTTGGERKRLVETLEIVTLPSVSVIMALRARDSMQPARTIAVFADPVVGERDPRLGQMQARARTTRALADGAASGWTDLLGRLPSTADEARAIEALVPAADRYVATGFEANREQVLSMDLTPYRFLHFATHGIVNARHPALSSLVLSRFDSHGQHREGSLRLYDIFDLELNASLVVLSACDTALGDQIRGEGLIGLAQGFMYAGARSMLVSLWQVPDRATAELMARFYGFMLDPVDPQRPAVALRKAQLALAENPRWRHPFYWAAFVLLGDWQ